jgi:hypothetical protein
MPPLCVQHRHHLTLTLSITYSKQTAAASEARGIQDGLTDAWGIGRSSHRDWAVGADSIVATAGGERGHVEILRAQEQPLGDDFMLGLDGTSLRDHAAGLGGGDGQVRTHPAGLSNLPFSYIISGLPSGSSHHLLSTSTPCTACLRWAASLLGTAQ